MSRGNSKAYLNSNMVEVSELDTQVNSVLCNYALDIFTSELPDLFNDKEVKIAIENYFKNCDIKGLRPGNLGLYASLGINKKQVYDLIHGNTPGKASVKSIELIKKAIQAIGAYREMLGSMNKIQAPVLIFWQKNFDGLEDVQRVDVAPVNTLQADKTPEQIASEIPLDSD